MNALSKTTLPIAAMLLLAESGCAVTRVSGVATNATGTLVTVSGRRTRALGLGELWIEQNVEWDCRRREDERLACLPRTTTLPAP